MPGSVKIKSTGFKEPTVKYSNERIMHEDPACPHPMTDGVPAESMGSLGKQKEWTHEVKAMGTEGPGVGNMRNGVDAAHEDLKALRDPANRKLE